MIDFSVYKDVEPADSAGTDMHKVEALNLLPVWVEPGHLVSSAKLLLNGHKLRAIGVLDKGHLAGVVSIESLSGLADFTTVSEAMQVPELIVNTEDSIREIAEKFVEHDVDYAPVVQGDKYLGIVTSVMLLKELGRSWDPLTGLSWSDHLREWGIDNLKRGNEVTIIFIDLDHFGTYNKRFGHIIGDKVLKRVASMIKDSIDLERDVLVRYGGDEFAIGTIRSRGEAGELAAVLNRKMGEISVTDEHVPVTFSLGIFGGKRTKERENIHYAATLDNLINLASKECLANKVNAPAWDDNDSMQEENESQKNVMAVVEDLEHREALPDAAKKANIEVVQVFTEPESPNALTQVILNVNGNAVSGVHPNSGSSNLESVAHATAKALEKAYPGLSIHVNDIHMTSTDEGHRYVTISGRVLNEGRVAPVGGVKTVETTDLYRGAAIATIDAFLSASG